MLGTVTGKRQKSKRPDATDDPAIIMTFTEKADKIAMNKIKTVIKAKEIKPNTKSEKQIYVSENLPAETRQLFYLVRQCKIQTNAKHSFYQQQHLPQLPQQQPGHLFTPREAPELYYPQLTPYMIQQPR